MGGLRHGGYFFLNWLTVLLSTLVAQTFGGCRPGGASITAACLPGQGGARTACRLEEGGRARRAGRQCCRAWRPRPQGALALPCPTVLLALPAPPPPCRPVPGGDRDGCQDGADDCSCDHADLHACRCVEGARHAATAHCVRRHAACARVQPGYSLYLRGVQRSSAPYVPMASPLLSVGCPTPASARVSLAPRPLCRRLLRYQHPRLDRLDQVAVLPHLHLLPAHKGERGLQGRHGWSWQ